MRFFKKIVYTLLGLTMAGTIGLIGVILFAEYKGQLFKMSTASDSADEESRLVYDENGNLAELPGGIIAGEAPAQEAVPAEVPQAAADPASATDSASAADSASATAPASAADSASATDTGEEHHYIMNKESSIFHLDTCPDAANISADNKLSMTSARDMVTGRGYQPCLNCNP